MEDVSFLCILFIFAFSPFPIRQTVICHTFDEWDSFPDFVNASP